MYSPWLIDQIKAWYPRAEKDTSYTDPNMIFITCLSLQRNTASELMKSAFITDSLRLKWRRYSGYSRIEIGRRLGILKWVVGKGLVKMKRVISDGSGFGKREAVGTWAKGRGGWFVTKALNTLSLIFLAQSPGWLWEKPRQLLNADLYMEGSCGVFSPYVYLPSWNSSLDPSRSGYTTCRLCPFLPYDTSQLGKAIMDKSTIVSYWKLWCVCRGKVDGTGGCKA